MFVSKGVRSIPASLFKQRCLTVLDEVVETGEEVIVTKRGRSIVRIAPMRIEKVRSLRGSVLREKDLVSPIR